MAERRTLETKRKIITLTRNRETPAAIKLFHKFFTDENPADVEFINSFFLELNRLNLFEAGYKILEDTEHWHPDDSEHQTLKESASKLYVDHLVLQGNNYLFEREDTSNRLEDSLRRSDSLSREKMRGENEKILTGITLKALSAFEKANQLQPANLVALSGLKSCFAFLGEKEKLAEVEAAIEARRPDLRRLEFPVQEEGEELTPSARLQKEIDVEENSINEIKGLFAQKKFEEVIKEVDRLHLSHRTNVPMLLLKARSLAELRRFKDVEKVMFEAERENTHLFDFKDTRNDLNELKYKLLIKAADFYLGKATAFGPSLGREHFKKARISLQRALSLNPENLDLLDKYYTALKYLGEEEEAFKTKAMIYVLNPRFVTSFDNAGSSSLCFIASYAFAGEPAAIDDFRWFRREFLIGNRVGRMINSLYMRWSPGVVKSLQRFAGARTITRNFLQIPLFIVKMLKKIKTGV